MISPLNYIATYMSFNHVKARFNLKAQNNNDFFPVKPYVMISTSTKFVG